MGKQVVWNDKRIVGSPVVHMGCLAVVLFAFWMALSGHTETKFIVYGVITALVTTWLTYPLLLVPNKEESRLYYVFGFSPLKMIWYFIWLMWQLVLANVDVLLAESRRSSRSIRRWYASISGRTIRWHRPFWPIPSR